MTFEAQKLISEQRSLNGEINYLESLIDITPDQEAELRSLKSEFSYQTICPLCEGDGEIVAQHKINSRTIDIPYMTCSECSGRGVV